MNIKNKITWFLREYIFVFSVILTIIGMILFIPGILHYIFSDDVEPSILTNLGDWNFYLLIIGLIIFIAGVSYLYGYLKNKRFILREIDTNKRSEFIKRHTDLRNASRRMPSKYKKMIEDKEKEFNIK